MAKSKLLVCSNRGPYTYEGSVDAPVAKRGGGGMISSVASVLERSGGTWLAAPLSDTDRRLAQSGRTLDQSGFGVRFLDITKEDHRLHYEVVSNEVLWFLFHYLFDPSHTPTFDGLFPSAWDGYRRVNDVFADAVAAAPGDVVLIEDYQMMLVGSFLRAKSARSRRPLIYFHHTPWCEPDYFSLLPNEVALQLLNGLLSYDVVGFHSRRWADAFVRCCDRFVKGASVTADSVRKGRRTTTVLVAPVPVDADHLATDLADPSTQSWVESHDELREGRKLLLRVDRIDLSKNPLRGFLAFEQLLERRPELVNEVLFMAMLNPSRQSVERYQTYYSECLGAVRRINERYEKKVEAAVGPVHLLFEDDYHRSLGAMRLYDVLLVNPIFDGLNLVSKEGAVVNERAGSLILSKNAGAYEELASACLPVNPFDVPATADAIERALELPQDERTKMSRKLKRLASRSDPADWLRAQLVAAGV